MGQDVGSAIDAVLTETRWRDNPYFTALHERRFARADFVETQIQFYSAVTFFSRPMAALCGKIPSPEQRVAILRNVWEEHGEGDTRMAHGATFRLLLQRLANIGADDIERRTLWPEVRIFNTTLAGVCVLDEYVVACAAMGMIERMFAEISGVIGREIVANGWLTRQELVHYDFHERVDVRHAEDFFAVIAPEWPAQAYEIEQGLRLGATVFDGLYRGLWDARARRLLRPT